MVAIVAQKLRETYDCNDDAVASIFISPCMQWNETSRAEVLLSVLRQLKGNAAKYGEGATPLVPCMPPLIEQIRQQNPTTPLIEVIHQELEVQLKRLKHAFLLVDGIDWCGRFSDTSLEFDIQRLQELGLKVFLTSRTLAFDEEDWENGGFLCDNCSNDDHNPLQVYWICKSESHPQDYILCQSCHVKLKSCPYPDWYVHQPPEDHIGDQLSLTYYPAEP